LWPEDCVEAVASESAGQTGKRAQRWRSKPWNYGGGGRRGRNSGHLMDLEVAGYNKRGFETFGHGQPPKI
jgi:hypothetical protein